MQVFKGNTGEDPFTKKKNDLTDANLVASMIRIWPVRSNGSCTQVKLYGQNITDNTPARHSGKNRVCMESASTICLGLIIVLNTNLFFSIRGKLDYKCTRYVAYNYREFKKSIKIKYCRLRNILHITKCFRERAPWDSFLQDPNDFTGLIEKMVFIFLFLNRYFLVQTCQYVT